ncbi:MAG: acylphosphatase [Thermodesulfobacteriota bacterium]
MEKQRVHIKIHGKVQGVFFRASTKDKARELNIYGFVKNNSDGTVEVIAEGDTENLQKLLAWCHVGPDRSRVDHVNTDWQPYLSEFKEFSIN